MVEVENYSRWWHFRRGVLPTSCQSNLKEYLHDKNCIASITWLLDCIATLRSDAFLSGQVGASNSPCVRGGVIGKFARALASFQGRCSTVVALDVKIRSHHEDHEGHEEFNVRVALKPVPTKTSCSSPS